MERFLCKNVNIVLEIKKNRISHTLFIQKLQHCTSRFPGKIHRPQIDFWRRSNSSPRCSTLLDARLFTDQLRQETRSNIKHILFVVGINDVKTERSFDEIAKEQIDTLKDLKATCPNAKICYDKVSMLGHIMALLCLEHDIIFAQHHMMKQYFSDEMHINEEGTRVFVANVHRQIRTMKSPHLMHHNTSVSPNTRPESNHIDKEIRYPRNYPKRNNHKSYHCSKTHVDKEMPYPRRYPKNDHYSYFRHNYQKRPNQRERDYQQDCYNVPTRNRFNIFQRE